MSPEQTNPKPADAPAGGARTSPTPGPEAVDSADAHERMDGRERRAGRLPPPKFLSAVLVVGNIIVLLAMAQRLWQKKIEPAGLHEEAWFKGLVWLTVLSLLAAGGLFCRRIYSYLTSTRFAVALLAAVGLASAAATFVLQYTAPDMMEPERLVVLNQVNLGLMFYNAFEHGLGLLIFMGGASALVVALAARFQPSMRRGAPLACAIGAAAAVTLLSWLLSGFFLGGPMDREFSRDYAPGIQNAPTSAEAERQIVRMETYFTDKAPHVLRWGRRAHRWLDAFNTFDMFHAWWFNGLLATIALSVLSVAYSRAVPWRWSHLGFVLTHVSIATILIGSLLGALYQVRGFVEVWEGRQTTRYQPIGERAMKELPFAVRLDSFELLHHAPLYMIAGVEEDPKVPNKPRVRPLNMEVVPGNRETWKNVTVVVKRVESRMVLEPQDQTTRVRFTPEPGAAPVIHSFLVNWPGYTGSDGAGFRIRHVVAHTSADYDRILADGVVRHEIAVVTRTGMNVYPLRGEPLVEGQTVDGGPPVEGQTVEVIEAAGAVVRVGTLYKDFSLADGLRPFSKSDEYRNPGLEIQVQSADNGGYVKSILFSNIHWAGKTSEVLEEQDRRFLDVVMLYRHSPDVDRRTRTLTLLEGPERPSRIVENADGIAKSHLLTRGEPIRLSGTASIVVELLQSMRGPVLRMPRDGEAAPPDGWTGQVDLEFIVPGRSDPIRRRAVANYRHNDLIELGKGLPLFSLSRARVPPRKYLSIVSIIDGGQTPVDHQDVHVNFPLHYGAYPSLYRFYQASYGRNPQTGQYYSVFQVVSDPGIVVFKLGVLGLVIGVFTMFYILPAVQAWRRKRRSGSRVDPRPETRDP